MKIGTAAKESIRDLLSRKKVSELAILEFKDESRNVLVSMVCKLMEKLPLKYSLVRHASCLDPRQMGPAANRDECTECMGQLLKASTDPCKLA